MRRDLTEPCAQCPFRTNSMPGWLGPWHPKELLASLAMEPFACHPTISEDGQDPVDDTLQACAGAVLHLNRKCERSRNPWVEEYQDALDNAPPSVIERVFKWSHEFIAHHTQFGRGSWTADAD